MKRADATNLLRAIILLTAIPISSCHQSPLSAPQTGIIGKWRNAEGTYAVEFLPSGDCSARMSLAGHGTAGGPCTYTLDTDEITIHYHGLGATTPADAPNNSAKWRYTLSGDTLTVAVFGNSMTLHRVH